MSLPKSVLTKKQTAIDSKTYNEDGIKYTIAVKLRYDDECGNGHNRFSITGTIFEYTQAGSYERKNPMVCGCIHEEIEKYFPEFKKYIKWHLCSSDGPMHYIANTQYHASDKDSWGKKKGELFNYETSIKFGDFPITIKGGKWVTQSFINWLEDCKDYDFEVIGIDHDDRETYGTHYTFGGYGDEWHDCPFTNEDDALDMLDALQNHNPTFIKKPTSVGEGKTPDIKAARLCAIWPDATLEQLTNEKKLNARLPKLVNEFKTDMEELGFTY